MKFYLISEKLKEGLSIISRLSLKKLALPILENVLMKTEKNFVSFSFTNLETAVIWQSLAKIEKEGKCCVKRKVLVDLFSFLPEGKITIEKENSDLCLKTSSFSTKIKGVNPEEFPVIPRPKEEEFVEIEGNFFCETLKKLFTLPSPSLARPEISGIYLSFSPQGIVFAATDSFRLAEKKIIQKLEISKDYSLILPQVAAREIFNIFGGRERIKIYLSPNQIFIESRMKEIDWPEILYTARLIEGEYPNYQEILPKKFETEAKVDTLLFLKTIKAASIFSSKINEIKFKFLPKENKIKILAQNPDLGQMESEMPAQIKGKEIQISFNYKFLIDGISSIEEKQIQILLTKPDGPAMLKPLESQDYFYLLMPIKTS